jgi:hypothetical protein
VAKGAISLRHAPAAHYASIENSKQRRFRLRVVVASGSEPSTGTTDALATVVGVPSEESVGPVKRVTAPPPPPPPPPPSPPWSGGGGGGGSSEGPHIGIGKTYPTRSKPNFGTTYVVAKTYAARGRPFFTLEKAEKERHLRVAGTVMEVETANWIAALAVAAIGVSVFTLVKTARNGTPSTRKRRRERRRP